MSWHAPHHQLKDASLRRIFQSLEKRLARFRADEPADATVPGSVVKRISVYDADGELVGYVAVYDDIT
jgi:hypothetical protein